MRPTFVIGDVHGHIDRLQALLVKAGVLEWDVADDWQLLVPTGLDAEVVQLGDLGHFGRTSHFGDLVCYDLAYQIKMTVLWGNHDYAAVHPALHSFRGYDPPHPELRDKMKLVAPHFAVARHGYLLTHAGLADHFGLDDEFTVDEIAQLIQQQGECPERFRPLIDTIGYARGGSSEQGGVLWRDAREGLANIPQVFGHTRGPLVRQYGMEGESFCIDVADKEDPGNLAGIWLPSREIVAIGPDANFIEMGSVQE